MVLRLVLAVLALGGAVLAQQAARVPICSAEKEAALGAALARNIEGQTHRLESGAVQDYVAGIGSRLGEALPENATTRTFAISVVSDSLGGRTHEPVSLPGGYVFVPASLIIEARNESELAGMLAHAMAHIIVDQATRTAAAVRISNLATIPLIFMGGWNGLGSADDVLVPAGLVNQQRSVELESDREAVRTLAAAGYDPRGLVRYVGRVQPATKTAARPSGLPEREVRMENLEKAIAQLPSAEYRRQGGFEAIQEETTEMVSGPVAAAPTLKRPGER
jgi:predicted Zn-dependent protease